MFLAEIKWRRKFLTLHESLIESFYNYQNWQEDKKNYTLFFYKHCNIFAQAQMLLSKVEFSKKYLTLPDKKVFKMLLGMCTIILKWSRCPNLDISRYSYFKIGQSEPRVA